MDFPPRIPAKLVPRSDMAPEELRRVINQRGLRTAWEQAADCPCVRLSQGVNSGFGYATLATDKTTAEARPDCEVCKGLGYFWHSSQNILAQISSAFTQPQAFASWGEYAKSMVSITTLPEHIPGLFDRFTLRDSVLVFRESRRRSAATVEALRFPIVSRSLDLATGPKTVDVLYAHRTDTAGIALLTDILTPDTDFVVDGAGKIDWTLGDANGKAPLEGAYFAMSYYARPRYVVVDYPHSFRDTWIKNKAPTPTYAPLPVQVVAQLEFTGDK